MVSSLSRPRNGFEVAATSGRLLPGFRATTSRKRSTGESPSDGRYGRCRRTFRARATTSPSRLTRSQGTNRRDDAPHLLSAMTCSTETRDLPSSARSRTPVAAIPSMSRSRTIPASRAWSWSSRSSQSTSERVRLEGSPARHRRCWTRRFRCSMPASTERANNRLLSYSPTRRARRRSDRTFENGIAGLRAAESARIRVNPRSAWSVVVVQRTDMSSGNWRATLPTARVPSAARRGAPRGRRRARSASSSRRRSAGRDAGAEVLAAQAAHEHAGRRRAPQPFTTAATSLRTAGSACAKYGASSAGKSGPGGGCCAAIFAASIASSSSIPGTTAAPSTGAPTCGAASASSARNRSAGR